MLFARPLRRFTFAALLILMTAQSLSASAFIRGAYYRLRDDDPGATNGATGNDPTRDSFGDALHLSRFAAPSYSSDIPARGPQPNKLSMSFPNGSPAALGFYGRGESLSMIEQGYALEAWVKSASLLPGGGTGENQLIAYNGDPASSGFGLYRDGLNYVARIGAF